MTQGYAKAIRLRRWQSPVADVLLIFSEEICSVYFCIQNDSDGHLDPSSIGRLQFSSAHAVRSCRTEVLPYYDRENSYHSCILEVFESPWLPHALSGIYSEDLRASRLKKMRHFIVAGHDIYHELAAEAYEEQYIGADAADFELASRCLFSKR